MAAMRYDDGAANGTEVTPDCPAECVHAFPLLASVVNMFSDVSACWACGPADTHTCVETILCFCWILC